MKKRLNKADRNLLDWFYLMVAYARGEALQRVRFDMSYWVETNKDVMDKKLAMPPPENWCGTACCSAGLAIVCNIGGIKLPNQVGDQPSSEALPSVIEAISDTATRLKVVCGLSDEDWDYITSPVRYQPKVKIQPKEVIAHMIVTLIERDLFDATAITVPADRAAAWAGRDSAFDGR